MTVQFPVTEKHIHQDLMTISTEIISEITFATEESGDFWNLQENLLQRDLYEESLVEVRQSLVAGAGEGIFMKQEVEANTVVAFYNGVR